MSSLIFSSYIIINYYLLIFYVERKPYSTSIRVSSTMGTMIEEEEYPMIEVSVALSEVLSQATYLSPVLFPLEECCGLRAAENIKSSGTYWSCVFAYV